MVVVLQDTVESKHLFDCFDKHSFSSDESHLLVSVFKCTTQIDYPAGADGPLGVR